MSLHCPEAAKMRQENKKVCDEKINRKIVPISKEQSGQARINSTALNFKGLARFAHQMRAAVSKQLISIRICAHPARQGFL